MLCRGNKQLKILVAYNRQSLFLLCTDDHHSWLCSVCSLYAGSHLKQPLSGTLQIKVAEGKESMEAGPTVEVTHATSHRILAETMRKPEINRGDV